MDRSGAPATIARLAVQALVDEALLTPKPGLVDRRGPGAHTDMDLAMLLRSAASLTDTFEDLARAGAAPLPDQVRRDRVGAIGRIGEVRMLDTTGGVNTHRGAIWTLGLLVTASASAATESEVFARAAALARTRDSAGGPVPSSHGQRAVRTYGVPGAVGEAAAGFPHICGTALPALRTALHSGATRETAALTALLALVATVADTCILHRGGVDGLRWMQRSARRTLSSRRFSHDLARFAREADNRRLSPGGSADLLAGALFVDSLTRSLPGGTPPCARLRSVSPGVARPRDAPTSASSAPAIWRSS